MSALRHLEEDRFDQFPAEVFAKGFLRNYARELQIGVDDVMLAYQALKQHQIRQDVGLGSEMRKREPVSSPVSVAAVAAAAATRRTRRSVRSERREVEASVTPLVLAAPEGERESAAGPVDASSRTFRFAYLIVFLVVVTSLGLSVLFTGTGEAEENGRRRARPVLDGDADKGSRWLMTNQRLTTQGSSSSATAERSVADSPASSSSSNDIEPVVIAPAPIDTAAAPAEVESDAPAASPTERWNRPAFPQDDHE